MDRRKQKTLRAIRNAFLALRSRMPLEKITVRELSDLAEISKATFYLHYTDIYALSEQLQREVIEEILRGVTRDEKLLTDIEQTSKALSESFCAYQAIIGVLFSGTQASDLPRLIEKGIRDCIYMAQPEKKTDAVFNVLLTYKIYGAYYAYARNAAALGDEPVLRILDRISDQLHGLEGQVL